MTRPALLLLPLLATACLRLEAEDWTTWYDEGTTYDIEEPVEFTDTPYDLPAAGEPGISNLLVNHFDFPRGFGTNVSPDAFTEGVAGCDNWYEDSGLPLTITGVVTAHPRYYFKARGCDVDDEKYYGSYWIEDSTGGIFVLGDSKVAHFDMGDTVTLEVLAARTSFDLDMIYSHRVIDVERSKRPIFYDAKNGGFGDGDVGEVKRVRGTVVSEPDNFGEVRVLPEGETATCAAIPEGYDEDSEPSGNKAGCVFVNIDVELQRRGITFEVGEQVQLTGPIIYSFSAYALVITRVGQIERLTP